MATWEIEYTDEFFEWWETLSDETQDVIAAIVGLLGIHGSSLGYPHSSKIQTSKHAHMRELRAQHKGDPYRVLYAFDPRRCAILLIGGKKTGQDRWYEEYVPIADKLYDEHLDVLKKEGLI